MSGTFNLADQQPPLTFSQAFPDGAEVVYIVSQPVRRRWWEFWKPRVRCEVGIGTINHGGRDAAG